MMRIKGSSVNGHVSVPSSKSMTHRALVLASLADGVSLIKHPLFSDDTLSTINVLRGLNVPIEKKGEDISIIGNKLSPADSALFCGESGTTMRLMCAVATLINGVTTLEGGPSLSKRPIGPLLFALNKAGALCTCDNGYPPARIHGFGGLNGGEVDVQGDISSQFISALLLVAPLADTRMSIKVTTRLESKPYVEMTLDCMRSFGVDVQKSNDMRNYSAPLSNYKPAIFDVEGDWSSAAYMLAAGALSGDVIVDNINILSNQADKSIIELLSQMGAELIIGKSSVESRCSQLLSIDYDLSDIPDLFPVVSALCTQAHGESTLKGLGRLKIKESDRIMSMTEGLRRMGGHVIVERDTLKIRSSRLNGATVNPYGDHRIAMSFAVLSLVSEGHTNILDPECVSKSYPTFWDHFKSLGVKTRMINYE
jgi:3-phosphoshikimate 1-carboxyvinyltransferase